MSVQRPFLDGPENNSPSNIVRSFPIVVSVYKSDDDKPIREEAIDYGNYHHRKWLGRITYWALSNGYLVETMARSDWENQQ